MKETIIIMVLCTGALARYPDMPVAFLIDWEGPSCPGKDLQRGLENDEAWAHETIRFLNNGREPAPEELSHFLLHGGSIFDKAYWEESVALRKLVLIVWRLAAAHAEALSLPE